MSPKRRRAGAFMVSGPGAQRDAESVGHGISLAQTFAARHLGERETELTFYVRDIHETVRARVVKRDDGVIVTHQTGGSK